MELREAITTRRSVRRFKPEPVPREIIIELLQAANMAPSASNGQPWEFIVLEKNDLLAMLSITKEAFTERFDKMAPELREKKLAKLSLPEPENKYLSLSRFYATLGGAPAVIIVYLEQDEDEYNRLLNTAGASAAVQNLLLAACDQGLGACWMMGPLQKKEGALKKLLNLPRSKQIIAIVPLGYPERVPSAPPKDGVEGKIQWGI